MTSTSMASTALLEWANSLTAPRTIASLDELSKGQYIWDILLGIDPEYFHGTLPEQESGSEQWLSRFQNLKHIVKQANGYLSQRIGRTAPSQRLPDLEAIAQNRSSKETDKLLRLVLLIAINCVRVQDYVMGLQSLSMPTQEALMKIIEEEQAAIDEPSVPSAPASPSKASKEPHYRGDSDFVFEERMGTVVAENEKLLHDREHLQKDLGDLHERHARLQENHEILQSRLTETEDRLTSVKAGRGESSSASKGYEDKLNEQADLIASLELKDQAAQGELEALRKQNETYRIKAERTVQLQDDYDMLKTEKEKLSRAANMAEKYKQKIQAGQDLEKENGSLKKHVNELRSEIRGLDNSESNVAFLQKQINEYQTLLPQVEQHRTELQEAKKSLELREHVLSEELKETTSRLEREQNSLEELRERVRELEEPGTPSTPKAVGHRVNGSFYGSSTDDTHLTTEAARLKDEAEQLKTENKQLKDDQNGSASFLKLVEEFAKLQAQIRDSIPPLEEEVENERAKREEALRELALVSKGDDAVGQLQVLRAAEEEFKQFKISRSEKYGEMEKEHRQLTDNLFLTELKLRNANEVRQKLDRLFREKQDEIEAYIGMSEEEIHDMLMKTQERAKDEKSGDELRKMFGDTIERGKRDGEKSREHIARQTALIDTLNERIEAIESDPNLLPTSSSTTTEPSTEANSELTATNEALRRENALIVSAWYDLTSRLQSSRVSVSRHRRDGEVPKGFLGRQRRAVESVTMGKMQA